MTVSLSYRVGAIILSVFQVFLAAAVKRSQDGLDWGTGNRDTDPPNYTGLAGRMVRARPTCWKHCPALLALFRSLMSLDERMLLLPGALDCISGAG